MERTRPKYLLFSLFISLNILSSCAQNACSTQQTCGDCLREPMCFWCSAPNDSIKSNHCRSKLDKNRLSCGVDETVDPQPSTIIATNRKIQTESGKPAIQISPQAVNVKLRVGEELQLNFTYAQAADYPVDLFFLMDLSASMLEHKLTLSVLGTQLAIEMRKLTKNVRLGFGSYVDKPELPYTSTQPDKLKNPCTKCVSPYGFKIHLPLTEDSTAFKKEVMNAAISGNLDYPEGGLDALVQTMVCMNDIGWRNKARRMVIFSTDAGIHFAGDGKLAGIVEPNDGLCHMENGIYTHSLLMDYPSIGQVNYLAKEHNMVILFTVTSSMVSIFKKIGREIEGSEVGELTTNSSNVVDLIQKVYKNIVDSVVIADNSDDNIEVQYYSSCGTSKYEKTNTCKSIHVGNSVNFTAVIKLKKCPGKGEKLKSFDIRPGTLDESLTVSVEALCSCDCESPGNPGYIKDSINCSGGGSLECGVCNCNEGKFGSQCECDGSSTSTMDHYEKCRRDNTSDICSGLGTCKCGQCVCNVRTDTTQLIHGQFCECKNYTCDIKNGQMCSSNGYCNCGMCICNEGWNGTACDCSTTTDKCIDPKNNKVCWDRGECKCGKCECGGKYTGLFCELCPSCPTECELLQACVECVVYKEGPYNMQQCNRNCMVHHWTVVEKLNTSVQPTDSPEKVCHIHDNTDCSLVFKFIALEDGSYNITAPKQKICVPQVSILAIVGSVIGSILLAGIVLLVIWKVFTTIHDRREYSKFENERKNANWSRGENPLFKSPLQTFQNPSYAGQ